MKNVVLSIICAVLLFLAMWGLGSLIGRVWTDFTWPGYWVVAFLTIAFWYFHDTHKEGKGASK